MKKLLLPLALFAAASTQAYDAGGPDTTVDYIYANEGASVYVNFGSGAMPGCYDDRGGYIGVATAEGRAQLYAGLLAAKAQNQTVQVLYNYRSGGSGWGLCYIHGVYFK